MHARQLDHVAIRVADRDATAERLVQALDLHVVERTERLTLLGPSATDGKLTLFDAPDGAQLEGGSLVAVQLAEPDPAGREPIELDGGVLVEFGTHERVDAAVPRHALVGVTLEAADPAAVARDLVERYGFEPRSMGPLDASVASGTGVVSIVRRADVAAGSVLDHVGLLVDSVDEHRREATERAGIEVLRYMDAANTRSVFLEGPNHVQLEYVEHKPEFALS